MALAREVWRHLSEQSRAPIVPALDDILVTADEGIRIAVKDNPGAGDGNEATIRALGDLLHDLLAPDDAPPEYRAPAALRRLAARARGEVDPPEFTWVEEFLLALRRFEPQDPVGVLGSFCRRHARSNAVPPPSGSSVITPLSDEADGNGASASGSDAGGTDRVQALLAEADEGLARSRAAYRSGSQERRRGVPRPDVVRRWLRTIDREMFSLVVQRSDSPAVLPFPRPKQRSLRTGPTNDGPVVPDRRSNAPCAADLRRLLREAEETLFREQAGRRISAAAVETAGRQVEHAAVPPGSATISDIRRARRATRVPLAVIAERTRIPIARLRELEWGYLERWPGGAEAESWLCAYAREAGIDLERLLETVRLDVAGREQPRQLPQVVGLSAVARPLEPAAPALVRLPRRNAAAPGRSGRRTLRRRETALPLAAGVLLALVSFGAGIWWSSSPNRDPAGPQPVSTLGADRDQLSPAPLVGSEGPEVATDRGPDGEAGRREAAAESDRLPGRSARVISGPAANPESGGGSRRAAAPPATGTSLPSAARRISTPAVQESARSPEDVFLQDPNSGAAVVFSTSDYRADEAFAGRATLEIVNVADGDGRVAHAQVSPDGQRVAFDSDREGVRSVYIANRDGSNVRRVSRSGYAAAPAWSPDGSRLVFLHAGSDDAARLNLWMLEIASGESRRISAHESGRVSPASWFPDGRRVCYGYGDRLVIAGLDGTVQRHFDLPGRGSAVMGAPAVSPDGRRVIVRIGLEGVWLVDLRDDGMRRILGDEAAKSFTWTPDGQRVAYRTGEGEWRMWVMASRE